MQRSYNSKNHLIQTNFQTLQAFELREFNCNICLRCVSKEMIKTDETLLMSLLFLTKKDDTFQERVKIESPWRVPLSG